MKLSVMTLPLLPMPDIPGIQWPIRSPETPSLTELYGQIKLAGADCLDISSMDYQYGGEAAVLAALEANGLKCSCYLAFISAPGVTDTEQAQAVAAGKAAVEQTLRLGANVMMFVPAGNEAAVHAFPRQEVAARFAAVLRPVVTYAAEKQVTVVIEDAPHRDFPMCSEAELRDLLEAVPGLKLVYDSGNMLFAGEDPVAYYDHLAEYAAHAHLKEICRTADGALSECRPGDGIIDFQALFSRMRTHNFDGYMAIELAPDFSGSESVETRVRYAINYYSNLMEKER